MQLLMHKEKYENKKSCFLYIQLTNQLSFKTDLQKNVHDTGGKWFIYNTIHHQGKSVAKFRADEAGIILCVRPANKRRRYTGTSSLTGIQNMIFEDVVNSSFVVVLLVLI